MENKERGEDDDTRARVKKTRFLHSVRIRVLTTTVYKKELHDKTKQKLNKQINKSRRWYEESRRHRRNISIGVDRETNALQIITAPGV